MTTVTTGSLDTFVDLNNPSLDENQVTPSLMQGDVRTLDAPFLDAPENTFPKDINPDSVTKTASEKEGEVSLEDLKSNGIDASLSLDFEFADPNEDRLDISNIGEGTLPDCLKEEAEYDLHEKWEWINRDIEALREMVVSETGLLSRTDNSFLLTFLRARKFDYEKAMHMIRGYYSSRRDNHGLYFNLIPSTLPHVWPLKIQTVLSKPDFKGRTVVLFFTEAWNTEVATLEDIFRAQILTLEHIVRLPITQLRGVTAVVDCKGLSFNQVSYLTPSHVRRMVSIIQEVFPLRFKALHFVNEPSIFDWAFSLVKPFLSDTIKGRLHFHGENLRALQLHFPKEILPEELGGDGGPVDNSHLVDVLNENEDYFRDHFSYGYLADEVATEATESPFGNSVFNSVTGMGSLLGSYYRRMCFE